MTILQRLFGTREADGAPRALYAAIVAEARAPQWYRAGAVPDSFDGRFDMVAAVLSLVLLRLESEGEEGVAAASRLAELFVADMDPQLRERGIGDLLVGKHVGRMMAALGGRIGAYREGLRDGGDLEAALARNLYRGGAVAPEALGYSAARLRAFAGSLAEAPLDRILAGALA